MMLPTHVISIRCDHSVILTVTCIHLVIYMRFGTVVAFCGVVLHTVLWLHSVVQQFTR